MLCGGMDCDLCKKSGHTKDKCFELIGYPPKWKRNSRCDHCKKYGHTEDQCFELTGYPTNRRRRNSGSEGRGGNTNKHRIIPTTSKAKKNDQAKKKKAALVHNKTWDTLDLDILKKIFDLLPSDELIWNISLVCRCWQLACWDKLFWSKDGCCLNLTPAPPQFSSMVYDKDLSSILRTIFYGRDAYGNSLRKWRQSIKSICISFGHKFNDKLLKNLSVWIPNVVSLELLGPSTISQKGFRMLARRYWWKSLQEVYLNELSYSKYVAFFKAFSEEKGRRFKELHISKRDFALTKKLAYKMIPGVHSFQKVFFVGAHLYDAGLWRLLRPVRETPWLFRRFEFSKCLFVDFLWILPESQSSENYFYPFMTAYIGQPMHDSPSKLSFERSQGLYKWWIIDEN